VWRQPGSPSHSLASTDGNAWVPWPGDPLLARIADAFVPTVLAQGSPSTAPRIYHRPVAIARFLYTIGMYLLTPVILYRLAMRGLRYREYFARWQERFGFFAAPGIDGSIWVHAVSVGESTRRCRLMGARKRKIARRGGPTGQENLPADLRSAPNVALARPPPTRQTAENGRLNVLYARHRGQ